MSFDWCEHISLSTNPCHTDWLRDGHMRQVQTRPRGLDSVTSVDLFGKQVPLFSTRQEPVNTEPWSKAIERGQAMETELEKRGKLDHIVWTTDEASSWTVIILD